MSKFIEDKVRENDAPVETTLAAMTKAATTSRTPRTPMRKTATAAVLSVLAVLTASACQPAQGPAGTVTDRHKTYWSATKQWTYKLTVRKPDGTTATFKVLRNDWKSCTEQSAYPTCTGGQ